ncbi:DUF4365 domain-containing protein [Aquicoccus sp. SCR17]|nr:DUF4365 domain-containing protein [Carideicomes alvinocaridis]
MAKFRALAAEFGEFAEYERDRAGRDIGLHFVSQKADGGEVVAPALVWFQMKGVRAKTFSEADFEESNKLSASLDVGHLRFWYIAPEPTYLALYIESVDKFFVLNIQKYISENYGDDILSLTQSTLTVHVNKDSILDDQAFYLIKQRRSVVAWQDRIQGGEEHGNVFFRDAVLIRRIATASDRGVVFKLIVRKYGSKMRSEAYFVEEDQEGQEEPEDVWAHWQFMMPDELDRVFPYLEFEPDEDLEYWEDDPDWEWPPWELPNGKLVVPDGVFEEVEYRMIVALNDIGKAWAQTLEVMQSAGFIELADEGSSMVSVAPWHGRDV